MAEVEDACVEDVEAAAEVEEPCVDVVETTSFAPRTPEFLLAAPMELFI